MGGQGELPVGQERAPWGGCRRKATERGMCINVTPLRLDKLGTSPLGEARSANALVNKF